MKKLLCAVLILCLVPMVSLAEIDLSGLSTEELMDLNKAVIMEIFSRDDFQMVTVPAGTYKVGEDIPAGTYTVQADNLAAVSVMDKKGNYTAKIYTVTKENPVGKLVLEDGESVSIVNSVRFSPYAGLGF